MKLSQRTRCHGTCTLLATVFGATYLLRAADLPEVNPPATLEKASAQTPSLEQKIRSIYAPLPKPDGKPAAAPFENKARSAKAVEVYRKAAPAVVYITDGATGHGTGAFVSPEGWIITNNHVVEDMPYSIKHGSQLARVVSGKMGADGSMEVTEGYIEAIVYRRNERTDLALLKVVGLPTGLREAPHIELSSQPPVQGQTCFAIGHPSAGVLWTFRDGTIAGRGRFPHDFNDFILRGTDPPDSQKLNDRLKGLASHLVTLSTCGVNPGDSGGPLLDEEGKLVAVTFAVPADVGKRRLSYHVHLDEVKAFLKGRPAKPEVLPPSADFHSEHVAQGDLDKDNVPDVRVFLAKEAGDPFAYQIDLDQDSITKRKKAKGAEAPADEADEAWDFEFAIGTEPALTLFYDTDNDSAVDLVLQPKRAAPSVQLRLQDGNWAMSSTDSLPPAPFKDAALNRRYELFARGLGLSAKP